MNKGILITSIVAGALILAYYLLIERMEEVEVQQYSVISEDGAIEIRRYDSAIIATTNTSGNYKEASSKGFRKLAGYIFGSNEKEQKIAMTSPVWMSADNMNKEMHFMMPSEYNKEDLPSPADSSVKINEFPGGKFAAIQFDGFASDEKIEEHKLRLMSWLSDNDYHFSEKNIFYAGYNSPFKLHDRRNEILISLL
jgi:effector-binding domain-containing protein